MPELTGHLELTCAPADAGRSRISRQSVSVPFHFSKPYWNGRTLVAQVVNPTAGLFAGDTLRSEITVEPGASFRVTTPSASRVHTMPNGRAEVRQTFRVCKNAWFDYSPAMLIPQKQSRIRQSTRIEVEAGGELFFREILAPGRVAHGEIFQYEEIDWECDLIYNGHLTARERYFLRPSDASIAPLQSPFPAAFFASCYLITDRCPADHDCWKKIRALNSEKVRLGVTPLIRAGWSIKILTEDSLTMATTCNQLRQELSDPLPELTEAERFQ